MLFYTVALHCVSELPFINAINRNIECSPACRRLTCLGGADNGSKLGLNWVCLGLRAVFGGKNGFVLGLNWVCLGLFFVGIAIYVPKTA